MVHVAFDPPTQNTISVFGQEYKGQQHKGGEPQRAPIVHAFFLLTNGSSLVIDDMENADLFNASCFNLSVPPIADADNYFCTEDQSLN